MESQKKNNVVSQRSENVQSLIDFLNGGIAGIVSKTITAPIERVKLILQTEIDNKQIKQKYNGMIDCFQRCIKEEGVISLWRGNWANVVRYFPTQALNFSLKEKLYKLLKVEQSKQNKKQYVIKSIYAGGIAGAITSFIVYPLDMARTRMGVDLGRSLSERQFTGLVDCILKIYRADGIRGIYSGLNSCLFGVFIYRGLYFGLYDSGKTIFLTKDMEKSYIARFFFAQFIVITSETLSYPTDTIKRRLMMQSFYDKNKKYKNAIDCTIKIYQNEGMQGFMKGCFSNMARGVGAAICLVLFDELQKLTA